MTDPLNREWIEQQSADAVLEQLCRNAVFANWLAGHNEVPFVVNLVPAASETHVAAQIQQHLNPNTVKFRRCTWEEVYRLPAIQSDMGLALRGYIENKTLRLQKAFSA